MNVNDNEETKMKNCESDVASPIDDCGDRDSDEETFSESKRYLKCL